MNGHWIPHIEVALLGSLVVRVNGNPAVPSAPKLRQLVALLLLHANRAVTIPVLAKELWEDHPPPSSVATLQNYVRHLRKFLGKSLGVTPEQVMRDVLLTKSGGYLFHIESGETDLQVYERTLADGRAALAEGRDEVASHRIGEALSVWRGSPMADVKPGPLLDVQIMRLRESRLIALEQRIEADMRLGRHYDVLSELIELVAEHPLNESLHAQLMLAFHRCGRRSQALATFQRLRRLLNKELGVGSSLRLERLHRAILTCDPILDIPQNTGAHVVVNRLIGTVPRSA
ncbi:AfsR/SARP family transcriptional regulator [Streptomyces sp. NPDC001985]|uniref:AfsR/SARP family transcriptional regulator n=1 Tax=Streptomyces sp. NPDC001985 TaxID=3154406 RepID=UPI003316A19E